MLNDDEKRNLGNAIAAGIPLILFCFAILAIFG